MDLDLSIQEIFEKGGVLIWGMAALSVLAVAVALERLISTWQYVDKARALAETVNRCLFRGAVAEGRTACERSRSPVGDVFLIGFERLGRSKLESLEGAVERERQRVTLDLKVRLWILGTIGATAPFIGLFGTVVGIMKAFRKLGQSEAATGMNFKIVAPQLAEALIVTAAGIAVAVEAVAIYNYLNQRFARIASEVKLLVDEFLEAMRERSRDKDGPREAAG